MALLDLVPTSPAVVTYQSEGQILDFTCLDSSNNPVTMSGMYAYRIRSFVTGGSGSASPLFADSTSGHFTGTSGNLAYQISAANAASIPPGSWSYIVEVQHTSGDDFQQVAAGTWLSRVSA